MASNGSALRKKHVHTQPHHTQTTLPTRNRTKPCVRRITSANMHYNSHFPKTVGRWKGKLSLIGSTRWLALLRKFVAIALLSGNVAFRTASWTTKCSQSIAIRLTQSTSSGKVPFTMLQANEPDKSFKRWNISLVFIRLQWLGELITTSLCMLNGKTSYGIVF